MGKSIVYATFCAVALMVSSCGGAKQVANTQATTDTKPTKTQREIQETRDLIALAKAQKELQEVLKSTESDEPCFKEDDDEWFYASMSREINASNKNTVSTALLRMCKQQMQNKLAGLYRALVSDYFDNMDTEEMSYERAHIESAGDQVINSCVNDIYEECRKTLATGEAGKKTMYMTVKMSKKKFVDDLVEANKNRNETKTRFNEEQFRKRADKVFENISK